MNPPPLPRGPLLQFIHSLHSWRDQTQVMLWPAGSPGLPQSKPGTARHWASALFFHQQAAYVNSPPASLSDASAGEVPYLIGEQPALGYPACPGTGHQRSGGRVSPLPTSTQGTPPSPWCFLLQGRPFHQPPARRTGSLERCPGLRSSSVLREPCVSGGVEW